MENAGQTSGETHLILGGPRCLGVFAVKQLHHKDTKAQSSGPDDHSSILSFEVDSRMNSCGGNTFLSKSLTGLLLSIS